MRIGPNSRKTASGLGCYWNWKAAVLSAASRGALFVAITVGHGKRYAVAAFFVEAIYRIVTSGFYGALTQGLRNIRPAWVGVALFAVLLPVLVQALDCGIHTIVGTPNLILGAAISCVWTALASLFDWYAMRKGVLITGCEAQSFWADMKAVPGVLVTGLSELFGSTSDTEETALLAEE